MTIKELQALNHGTIVLHKKIYNSDGSPARYKINGKIKLWKKSPDTFMLPIKRGLYEYGYITENNIADFYLP